MKFSNLKTHKCFSGSTVIAEHDSSLTKTKMKFSYFLPESKKPSHAMIWLSGLTCTEENFITKAGAQEYLAQKDMMVICPDTSPRGLNLPGEHDSYDFGSGAGFYINAKTSSYKDNYNMYDYIVSEVVELAQSFGVESLSLSGHSMGGHGALIIGLKEASLFSSVSAFSPIVNPMQSPWGKKAFSGYLGEESESLSLWKEYDACELILSGKKRNKILVDQGLDDEFLGEQLKTSNLEKVCQEMGQDLQVNYREGYDHSYYFISTFLKSHIDFHSEAL